MILAPMAGVSDVPFRSVCLEHGADLAFTEMVSAKGLSCGSQRTREMIALAEGESEVAVQIFGHEADVMAREAARIEQELGDSLAFVDVNMGCPARKVVKKGDGSALMREPKTAASIVKTLKQALSCKVTCKIRKGFHESDGETAPSFARILEEAGADAVTVHGRFASQLYKGHSDWGTIARTKSALSIPVVGNGDVFCADDALALNGATGCDAIMIARGAQGNPFIFEQIKERLEGNEAPLPSPKERIGLARLHLELASQEYDGRLVRMRKHLAWYSKGLPGASTLRGKLNECVSLDDFERSLDWLEGRLDA